MIIIRADANEKIATGHLMRCMSIAEQLRILGQEVLFMVADESGRDFVENQTFSCMKLDSQWDDWKTEISTVIHFLKSHKVIWFLIDSYYVTDYYIEEIQKYTKVAYIDDLGILRATPDCLINYAIYAEDMNYHIAKEKTLLGCAYAPLRDCYADLPTRKINEQIRDVLLLTGGSDPYHVALNFVKELQNNPGDGDVQYHVICGRYNCDIKQLEEIEKILRNVIVYSYVDNLKDLMLQAGIAVSAGGSTLYELCACGTPAISYSLADNQIKNVNKFDELGLIHYTGDVRGHYDYEDLFQKICILKADYIKRQNISKKMQALIDGKGAKRIAQFLLTESRN